jgi:hypothetical protein
MPFPLQDTKRDQAAGQVMPLSPLGTRLTAIEPELVCADADDFLGLSTHPRESADLRAGSVRRLVAAYVAPYLTTNTFRPPLSQPLSVQ